MNKIVEEKPPGKESTEVQITQNMGKNLPKIMRSAEERHTHKHTKYFDYHRYLSQLEESNVCEHMWHHLYRVFTYICDL